MKSLFKIGSFVALFFLTVGMASCEKDDKPENLNYESFLNIPFIQSRVYTMPHEPISYIEGATMVTDREIEKLARDVYLKLYPNWKVSLFQNISASKRTHMDAVLILLNKYQIPDPVGPNGPGVFSNYEIQEFYNQLTENTNGTLVEGYKIALLIEDLCNELLNISIRFADNKDIDLVYETLLKGSRNHLRLFYQNLLKEGGTYTSIYHTKEEFDAIINSPMETGF